MFWVDLDSRLIPPDEFQADSPQNQSQQGLIPQDVYFSLPYRKQRQAQCSWATLWRRGLRQKIRRSCGEELRGILPDDMKPRT